MAKRKNHTSLRIEIDQVRPEFFVADVLHKNIGEGWTTISSQAGATKSEAVTKTLGHLVSFLLKEETSHE